MRPEVPLISKPIASACRAEWLTRTRSGPYGSVTGPPSKIESKRPAANSREEMALVVASEIGGPDISDIPLVNVARGQTPGSDQIAQPLSRERVDLVIVDGHGGGQAVR